MMTVAKEQHLLAIKVQHSQSQLSNLIKDLLADDLLGVVLTYSALMLHMPLINYDLACLDYIAPLSL
jgi:hypothetical protein